MSAVNILLKAREAVVVTDAAVYTADGVLTGLAQKTYIFPALNLAISRMGLTVAGSKFVGDIASAFSSFDDLVAEADAVIPEIVGNQLEEWREQGADYPSCTLYFAGLSEMRGGPEAYFMKLCDASEAQHWRAVAAEQGTRYSAEPFRLQRLGKMVCCPPVVPRDLTIAGFDQRGTDDEIRERLDDTDLLAILELQRRQIGALRPGLPEASWIGGYGLATIISAAGITQRVIHRWRDTIGAPIAPEALDWPAWRAARAPQVSRLQREIAERRHRKTLRRKS